MPDYGTRPVDEDLSAWGLRWSRALSRRRAWLHGAWAVWFGLCLIGAGVVLSGCGDADGPRSKEVRLSLPSRLAPAGTTPKPSEPIRRGPRWRSLGDLLAWALLKLAYCQTDSGAERLFIRMMLCCFETPVSSKVPARFRVPEGKKVLVFVDDFRRPVSYEPIKQKLTEQISKRLLDSKVAASVVPYEKLEAVARAERGFNQMSIPNVARRLKADLVVYVEIRRLRLREHGSSPLWQGRADVEVKVVDSTAGLLWPKDRPTGYPVCYADPAPSEHISPTYARVVANRIAAELGRRIAQLFYKHTGYPAEWQDIP